MTRTMAQTTGYREVTRAPNGTKPVRKGLTGRKKNPADVATMLESVVGCKWSMSVLAAIRAGVHRPGALERACPGISTKVLNERLRKLVRFEIVNRRIFPEAPPRVEYRFTSFGRQFLSLIDSVEQLQQRLDQSRRGGR